MSVSGRLCTRSTGSFIGRFNVNNCGSPDIVYKSNILSEDHFGSMNCITKEMRKTLMNGLCYISVLCIWEIFTIDKNSILKL